MTATKDDDAGEAWLDRQRELDRKAVRQASEGSDYIDAILAEGAGFDVDWMLLQYHASGAHRWTRSDWAKLTNEQLQFMQTAAAKALPHLGFWQSIKIVRDLKKIPAVLCSRGIRLPKPF
jgi:hypothetical protein